VVASGNLDRNDGPATATFQIGIANRVGGTIARVEGRATRRSPPDGRATHFKGCRNFVSGYPSFWKLCPWQFLCRGAWGRQSRFSSLLPQIHDGTTRGWRDTQPSGFFRFVSGISYFATFSIMVVAVTRDHLSMHSLCDSTRFSSWHVCFSSTHCVFRMMNDYFE